MKQFKRAKVVMLPTNEKAKLHLNKNNELFYELGLYSKDNRSYGSNQHIHVLSNEENEENEVIKEGEWCYHLASKEIVQYPKGGFPKGHSKKVLASTDKSLCLPRPSQAFIARYIKEYNKDNVITDVLVECEKSFSKTECSNCNGTGYLESEDFMKPRCSYCNEKVGTIKEMLETKIDPKDNTITIKKLKDTWNEEELKAHAIDFAKEYSGMSRSKVEIQYNKWTKNGKL